VYFSNAQHIGTEKLPDHELVDKSDGLGFADCIRGQSTATCIGQAGMIVAFETD